MRQAARTRATALACAVAFAAVCALVTGPALRAQTQDTEAVGEAESLRSGAEDAIPSDSETPIALLQGLDKITARVSTFEAPVSQMVRFGTLQIVARNCQKRPPTEPPESAAFLEIVDQHPDTPPVELFTGWMFASSPALSGLEHPVYDVWVLDCLTTAGTTGEGVEQ